MEDIVIENVIIEYLDEGYQIIYEGDVFFKDLNYDRTLYGVEILREICDIYNLDKQAGKHIIYRWIKLKGFYLSKRVWDELFTGPKRLKTTWSPEMAQNIRAAYGIDAENELIQMLSAQISREIDSKIFDELIPHVKSSNDFIEVMKLVGYEISETIYNPENFTPMKMFIKMDARTLMEYRKNNPLWESCKRKFGL